VAISGAADVAASHDTEKVSLMNVMPRPAAMSRTGPTRALAEMAASVRYDTLDTATRHRAKYHILDSLGAVIAGARQEVTDIAEKAMLAAGSAGTVPVVGRATTFDILSAAFVMGGAGHGLELDDGFRAGSVHPGTVVIPALAAAAHVTDADGRRMIEAAVAGYEVMCRLAAAVHPRSRWRGFHNTSITGVFGAATVWGVLKGFDADRFEHAFGIAASTASGIFAFMNGGDVKRLHPGFAAKNGLLAGLLAEQGLAASPGVIENADGFFSAFGAGDLEPERYAGIDIRKAGADVPYAITACYIKPYASCRHIHAAIDAMRVLRDEHKVTPDDVVAIDIGSYKVAAAHDLKTWDSFTTAQMSIPFVVATALRTGGGDLEHFTAERRADPVTRALADRISVHVDTKCDADYPRLRSAQVKVATKAGKSFEIYVDNPYGEPEKPLSDAALTTKFTSLVAPVLGLERADAIATRLWRLEAEGGVRSLLDSFAVRKV
jgi:2-methylcitrate dehydratase PrpD